jgi:hypothetical protein
MLIIELYGVRNKGIIQNLEDMIPYEKKHFYAVGDKEIGIPIILKSTWNGKLELYVMFLLFVSIILEFSLHEL